MSEEAISGSDLEPSLNSEEEEEMEEEEDGENDGDDEEDAGGEHLFQFTPLGLCDLGKISNCYFYLFCYFYFFGRYCDCDFKSGFSSILSIMCSTV